MSDTRIGDVPRTGPLSGPPRSDATASMPILPAAPRSRTDELALSESVIMNDSLSDMATAAQNALVKEMSVLTPIPAEVVRDPADPNSDPDPRAAYERYETNLGEQSQALSKLPAEQQEAFNELASTISDDPQALLALQEMLLSGRLPGEKDLVSGKTLLENLHALSTQAVADGIDRKALVADLVQEVADPSSISQQANNTCGATTAQILLARQNPSEYVRLVAGLASPGGSVSLQNGATISRVPDWSAGARGRTLSSQLIQPSFMAHSNTWFGYSNEYDGRHLGPFKVPGMLPHELETLLEQVTGRPYHQRIPLGNIVDLPKLIGELRGAAPGREVPVMINYNEHGAIAPHWVLVTEVKDGMVSFINPWGREERVSEAEFLKRLIAGVPRS